MTAEIVRYRPEHKPLVARLQTLLWSPDPALNARYLEWKYERNPWAGDQPRIYLAMQGDRLLGMRGFFASRWEVGPARRSVAIPMADDLVLRAESRNSGLVTRIMQVALSDLAEAGFEYVFSLSAGLFTLLGSLSMGWRSAGRYDPWALRDPATPWQARLRSRVARAPLLWRLSGAALLRAPAERAPFRSLDRARLAAPGIETGRQPRGEAMARLVAGLGHDGRLRHVRTPEYLEWRFANPLHEYRFLYATGSGDLDGYLVLRSRVGSTGQARVYIADLEGRSPRVRAELLAAAVETGRFLELAAWTSTLQPGEREALAARGFEPADPHLTARGCPCALVRSTRGTAPADWALESLPLLDPASWDLRMLYSMAG
jgi:hypothetical protein